MYTLIIAQLFLHYNDLPQTPPFIVPVNRLDSGFPFQNVGACDLEFVEHMVNRWDDLADVLENVQAVEQLRVNRICPVSAHKTWKIFFNSYSK